MKILITGCGRSGTKYISRLLTQCGFDIKHEAKGKDGIASWYMVIPNGKAVFGPSFSEFDFDLIVHQVRNPAKVISSAHTFLDVSWNYIKKYVPIAENDSMLIKCAKYWYYWNLEAEKIANFTYRIEDIDLVLPKLVSFLGQKSFSEELLNKIPKDFNTRPHAFICLEKIQKEDEVLYEKIVNLAKKYGYKEEEICGPKDEIVSENLKLLREKKK
jgi:hypothetical protein